MATVSGPVSERRAAILGAAAVLFAERGFHGATIDELGRAVGTSGPALYRHFAGKEALLAAVLVDVSERLSRWGGELVACSGTPEQALESLLRGHIAFALDEPALITVHDRELGHLAEGDRHRVRRLQRGYVEVWVDVLARLRPGTGRVRLRAAVHAVFGLLNSTPHSHGELPREAMAELLLAMGTAALLTEPGAAPGRAPSPESHGLGRSC